MLQARGHIGELFAHGGRRGGLAVGAAEHGHVGVGAGHAAQLAQHALQRWQQHVGACGLQLQSMAGVVDVFAGAGKVDELHHGGQLLAHGTGQISALALRLDPIFHRFDIVIGGFLNVFDGDGISGAKVRHQCTQMGAGSRAEGRKLGPTRFAQGDQPGHFDLHTPVHIALFAHQSAQRGEFVGVAAVQRR